MTEKIILVTGATDGIGRQTALELARLGISVGLHGRDPARVAAAVEDIRNLSGNDDIHPFVADFSALADIRQMAQAVRRRFDHLDGLINNAGVFRSTRETTADGFEMTFGVNYLAAFALTGLLLELVVAAPAGRIINVSSMLHAGRLDFDNLQSEAGYEGIEAYGLSKLSLVVFTYALAERLKHTAVTVNCLHPGVINTKLLRSAWQGGATVGEGARTPVYLAVSPEVAGVSGRYFINRRATRSAPDSYDAAIQQRLWSVSEEMTGVVYPEV